MARGQRDHHAHHRRRQALHLLHAATPFAQADRRGGQRDGIPLTHRDHAARVVWVTGHLRAGCADGLELDWPALARPRQTLVVYMGLASLPLLAQRLIEHGLAAGTPAALVERATTPQQRTIVGTLGTLAAQAEAAAVHSPALLMIGEVVALQPLLARNRPIAGPKS
jgi:uroporphyrin-III C-methyltransferase